MKFRPRWVRMLPMLLGYAGLVALHAGREAAAALCYGLVFLGYFLEVYRRSNHHETE